MRPEPIFTPPAIVEMQSRLIQVQALMAAQNLDAYVAFSPDNVFYLTNFANFVHERPFILVVPRTGVAKFLVPKLEIPHVHARAVGEVELVPYREFPAPAGETWADHFQTLFPAGARVGVESICPLQVLAAIPGAWVRTDIVDEVRLVKSAYETGRITYACEVVSQAHQQLLAGARPGRTLPQVSGELTGMMMARILQDYPETNVLATRLTAIFQPGSISHDPHNFTNINMAMAPGGPHVSVINCVINGYGGEIERTFFLGHVPEEAKKPFAVMMAARELAFELTVPGNNMSEVDRRVNELFKWAGYAEFMLHRTGHGMGVTGHEAPFLAEGYDREIEPGMFFTIEPGIYLPGIGGFRHSDTIMTTADGNVTLTAGPVALADVTLA